MDGQFDCFQREMTSTPGVEGMRASTPCTIRMPGSDDLASFSEMFLCQSQPYLMSHLEPEVEARMQCWQDVAAGGHAAFASMAMRRGG